MRRPTLPRIAATALAAVLLLPLPVTAQVTWGGDDTDTPKPRGCPAGKERSDDTAGQCCWPGQAWNGRQCVGTPTKCPEGLQPDANQQACAIPGCLAEMVLMTDGTHCCWAGQAWSSSRSQCIGAPSCPENYQAQGDSCVYVPPDADGDGIIDAADKCPQLVEDVDGFEDLDGCPEEDNDRDQIGDISDQCPDQAEDLDGYQDDDGCPDEDNDKDGVADGPDQCPMDREDVDGFDDDDGCPDPDNDRDGIADAADQCPDAAEDANGFQDTDGCPDQADADAIASNTTLSVVGWLCVGLGALGGGAALGLHLDAESTRDAIRNPGSTGTVGEITSISMVEALQKEKDANTTDNLAVLSLGVGTALLVTGATLLVIRYTDDTEVGATTDGQAGLLQLTTRF